MKTTNTIEERRAELRIELQECCERLDYHGISYDYQEVAKGIFSSFNAPDEAEEEGDV